MFYEILIRGKLDGTIAGSHIIDFVNGQPANPRPIKTGDWPGILGNINTNLLATTSAHEEEIKVKDAELAAATKLQEAIVAAVNDSDTPTEDAVLALIEEHTLPGKIAAAEARVEAAQEELDVLQSLQK